jgi:predicted nuclease with RNAse H fold
MLILGYDPGGKKANGLALLHIAENGTLRAWLHTCNSVDQALEWVQEQIRQHGFETVDAVGIDTYLSWSTQASGWRPMDEYLKEAFPEVAKSVFSSNSARGSMAVQGMAMALRLRHIWPEIRLNETHPKILYYALSNQVYSFGEPMIRWLTGLLDPPPRVTIGNEHQWDALLSAWATWKGLQGFWSGDLMDMNGDRLLLPAGQVSYYWP